MKWLIRSLWLAAWGVWLWLGFGLYRELPRYAGAEVQRVPLLKGEWPLGFFADGDLLATHESDRGPRRAVRVWDVSGGERLREMFVATGSTWEPMPFEFSARHGVVVSGIPAESGGGSGRVGALDLRTGRWTELSTKNADCDRFHPEHPWVLLRLSPDADGEPEVIVADLRTGRHVFEWKRTQTKTAVRGVHRPPLFLPRHDALLVSIYATEDGGNSYRYAAEMWKIAEQSEKPERVFEGLRIGEEPGSSPSDRVVWTDLNTSPPSAQVFDPEHGVIASFPPNAERPGEGVIDFRGRIPVATLSSDGRAVYFEGTLWDVDRIMPIWSRREFERVELRNLDAVQVQEWWPELLGDWVNAVTWAVRDLSTSRVIYRLWQEGEENAFPPFDQNYINHSRSLYIDDRGAIRHYPPPPNWPLLALCQTILALPLILLWTILRWRRVRKTRMASVTP